MTITSPSSLDDVRDMVRSHQRIRVRGGGTKPALSSAAKVVTESLNGIIEYEPSEFTFTALAGTKLATVEAQLAQHGQFLPFDPPLVEAGATLGGTVAAGLSGPGRLRYGGLRDFILGVRLVTGEGRVVFGGSKVVKNAAGFDIPKLVTGSLGIFGILVELTFKVFPRPEAYATIRIDAGDLTTACRLMTELARSPLEPHCLDVIPPKQLLMRVGGLSESLPARVDRVKSLVGREAEVFRDDADRSVWNDAREFRWLPVDHDLVRMPLVAAQIPEAEETLTRFPVPIPRRYSVAGNQLWLAWPHDLSRTKLDGFCLQMRRSALALTGRWTQPRTGPFPGRSFRDRLLRVFDPEGKFRTDSVGQD